MIKFNINNQFNINIVNNNVLVRFYHQIFKLNIKNNLTIISSNFINLFFLKLLYINKPLIEKRINSLQKYKDSQTIYLYKNKLFLFKIVIMEKIKKNDFIDDLKIYNLLLLKIKILFLNV